MGKHGWRDGSLIAKNVTLDGITFDGASSTGTISGTQAGYIKVKIGSNTHYIQLYPTLS